MQPIAPSSREKILETAEVLFAARGFSAVGMREVADRVGLSKSALFHHFASKLELYLAVVERILVDIDARQEAAAQPKSDAFERVWHWIEVTIDTLAENPSHARLLLRTLFEEDDVAPEDEDHLDQLLAKILRRVGQAIQEGIDRGELRPVSIPHTLQSIVGMTVYHFASGPVGEKLFGDEIYSSAQVRQRKEEVFQLLRRGLLVTID